MSEASQVRRPLIRAPQDALAGIIVVIIAAAVLAALTRVTTTSYSTFSPALFPRVCAWLMVGGGLSLIARSFLRDGPGLQSIPFRAAFLVTFAVLIFGFITPRLGYAIAGLLTVVIGGLATPEARWRELGLLSVLLVGLSVALFGFLLKLPMPILILPGLRI